MLQVARIIGTRLGTTGLIGAGVGIGVVFGALILGVAKLILLPALYLDQAEYNHLTSFNFSK